MAVAATPKAGASGDKPDRLFIGSYTAGASGSSFWQHDYYDLDGNHIGANSHDETSTLSGGWQDGIGGSSSWNWNGTPGGSDWVDAIYAPSSYPDIEEEIVNTSDDDLDNPFVIAKEYCDMGVPLVDHSGAGTYPYDPVSGRFDHAIVVEFGVRHAQATMQLQTGGRSGSKLQNLFGFNGSATQLVPVKWPPATPFPNVPPYRPIPQQNIYINNVGYLPATGTKYKVLPDDTTIDVTPTVKGVDYYTFDENETKYHSHFEAFVTQPFPDYPDPSYDPIYNPEPPFPYPFYDLSRGTAGHAWWKLSSDAPFSAINQFTTSDCSQWLGREVGYAPITSSYVSHVPPVKQGLGTIDTANGSANIRRIYAVGFPGLISGLIYTESISNSPGIWNSKTHNCVHETVNAGGAAGVQLPSGGYIPEIFGIDLPPDDI